MSDNLPKEAMFVTRELALLKERFPDAKIKLTWSRHQTYKNECRTDWTVVPEIEIE